MRYCILTTIPMNEIRQQAVGFFQWAKVHNGPIFHTEELLPRLKDDDFDIIHICLWPGNLGLAKKVREKIGWGSKTKIAVTIDIPFESRNITYLSYKELKDDILKADIAFATEFTIAESLQKIAGKRIYELAHPADMKSLRLYQGRAKKKIITIITEQPQWFHGILGILAKILNYKLRILLYNEKVIHNTHTIPGIDTIICKKENDLCEALAESEIVFAPYLHHDYGKLVIYAAAIGCLVIGSNRIDALRRCYSFTTLDPKNMKGMWDKFFWLKNDASVRLFFIENAKDKVEYYNWGNSQKRFYTFLSQVIKDKRFDYKPVKVADDSRRTVFIKEIKYSRGKKKVNYKPDEFVIVCLVKNGMEYLHSFLTHYRTLVAKHFFFIDNGSTDKTVARLSREDDITLYTTILAHKKFESEIRRTIIEEHCWNRWCLCVDIDEFFDFPYSESISMKKFLRYLNKHCYTSVIAYILDMFALTLRFSDCEEGDNDLSHSYPYYDLSDIKKTNYYSSTKAYCNYNILADKKMKSYYGGIRQRIFPNCSNKYLLIKHPLVFIDGKIEPVSDPHYCNKSYVADVNGLLKHYKLTTRFKEKVTTSYNNYTYFAFQEYRTYKKVIAKKNELTLSTPAASILNSAQELIQRGFLRVSKQYMEYVCSEF